MVCAFPSFCLQPRPCSWSKRIITFKFPCCQSIYYSSAGKPGWPPGCRVNVSIKPCEMGCCVDPGTMVGLSLDLVRYAIEKGKSVSVSISQMATRGPWDVSHVLVYITWVSRMVDTVWEQESVRGIRQRNAGAQMRYSLQMQVVRVCSWLETGLTDRHRNHVFLLS